MGWRTVVVSKNCKLSYKNDYLIIRSEDLKMIHLSEINMIIIENGMASITSYLINELAKGTISSKQAKEIFIKVIEEKKEINDFVSKESAQISNKEELTQIIDDILANNPSQIEEYKNGRTNIFDYFVGQVMKQTRGKANPVLTKEILTQRLNNNKNKE